MAGPAIRVEVTGVPEWKADMAQLTRNLPDELRVALAKDADVVVDKAQAKLPSVSGEAAGSLKPVRGTGGHPWAGISRPKGGVPWQGVRGAYEPWLDFGGSVGRSNSIVRPRVKGGIALYPAIAETARDLANALEDAIGDVARRAGFEVRR